MTLGSTIETLVVSGLAPALAIASVSFGFSSHYSDAVTKSLQQTERLLMERTKNNGEIPGNVRRWSKEFHTAHGYRDMHTRCFWVPIIGSLAWVLAYTPAPVSNLVFLGGSPLGVPTSTGIKIIAILAWVAWAVDAVRIVRKFGVRPSEALEQGTTQRGQTDVNE